MERRARYCRSAKAHRVKHSRRRHSSGTSYRKLYVADYSFFFLRRILVCDEPSSIFGRIRTFLAVLKVIELYYCTVYVIRKLTAHGSYFFYRVPHFVSCPAHEIMLYDLYAVRLQEFVDLFMRSKFTSSYILKIEYEHRKSAFCSNGRVKLAQRPRCTIPRISEQFFAEYLLTFIYPVKRCVFHIHFAAYLKILELVFKRLNDVPYNSGVFCNVLSFYTPVTARYGGHELAVLIAQRHRKSVYLCLDYELCIIAELFFHIIYKFVNIFS